MTDDAAIIETPEIQPAATSVPANIPGNPAQTQATVKRFKDNPAEAEYVFSQLGYDQTAKTALAEAQKARIESATYQAAVKYNIPEDKLALIADATPEGIMQRAAALAPLLKQSPQDAAPSADTATGAAPPAKSAGIPLPAVTLDANFPHTRQGIEDALIGKFAANPLPKPPT